MSQTTLNQRSRQAARPRKVDAWRLYTMLGLFTVFGLYNLFTVFKLQVLQHTDLSAKAEERIKWKDTILPRRGLIYDSRGVLLAGNTTAYDVYVDKTHQKTDSDLHAIVDLLAPALGQDPTKMFTNLKEATGLNIKVANRVNDEVKARVDELKKNHSDLEYVVSLDPQPLRQYPALGPDGKMGLGAAVLGFSDYDNQGHYGVEESYNTQLGGEAGWIDAERDAYGRPLALEQPQTQPAVDGADVVLTLDSAVQYALEKELQRSLEEYKADYAYGIVQDPNTGAILAMANYPTFNGNTFSQVTNYEAFKNPSVNDVREPGSTMKILTYASSLDAGAITPDTSMYGTACISRYGRQLCNATFTAWGNQTMTQGLGRSDNIAAIFAAEQLGPDKYYDYMKKFGVGQRTGIDLPGEVAGLVSWPGSDGYSPVDFLTTAFGQSAAMTPVQLVNSVSAVANGGTLLKPYIGKEVRKDGEVLQTNGRTEVRQVLKPETSREIADMLAYGVENKMVARLAAVPGYHVSVKTGTANVLNAEGTGYSDITFASAMGFAPSHSPRFTLYIGLMHPRTSPWGENTASVSWGRLAKELLLYLKVQPTEPLPTSTP